MPWQFSIFQNYSMNSSHNLWFRLIQYMFVEHIELYHAAWLRALTPPFLGIAGQGQREGGLWPYPRQPQSPVTSSHLRFSPLQAIWVWHNEMNSSCVLRGGQHHQSARSDRKGESNLAGRGSGCGNSTIIKAAVQYALQRFEERRRFRFSNWA